MSINEKDFSEFDNADIGAKLNLVYRLLCHLETEIDQLRLQISGCTAIHK